MIERAIKFLMRILDIQENTRGVTFDAPMPDLPDAFPNPWDPQNLVAKSGSDLDGEGTSVTRVSRDAA